MRIEHGFALVQGVERPVELFEGKGPSDLRVQETGVVCDSDIEQFQGASPVGFSKKVASRSVSQGLSR